MEERCKDINQVSSIVKIHTKKGATIPIEIIYDDICKKCNGTGINENTECKNCSGTGIKSGNKELVQIINLHKIKNNDVFVFKEKGNRYKVGDTRGDAYIKIHICGK